MVRTEIGRKGKPQRWKLKNYDSKNKQKRETSTLWPGLLISIQTGLLKEEKLQINPGRLSNSSVALEKGFSNAFEPRTFLLGRSAASRKEKGESCLCQRPGVLGWPASLGCGHLLSSQFGAAAAALGCFFLMVQNWFDFSQSSAASIYAAEYASPWLERTLR